MFRRTSRKRGYLPSSSITALLVSFFPTLIEYLHSLKCALKQSKKSWYASIDTIFKYLNVSAKSILTTKRNIKSYFYSKLKPKYNAVWKTEIFNDRPGKQYGNKLRTYRLFKSNFAFESYLDFNLVLVSVNDINSFMTTLYISNNDIFI
jgi:hypothetical protein